MTQTQEEPMLEWFDYQHLPAGAIRDTSTMFHDVAHNIAVSLPRSPERTVALRKLLESKDAAVRCAVHEARLRQSRGEDNPVGKQRDRLDSPELRDPNLCHDPIAGTDATCTRAFGHEPPCSATAPDGSTVYTGPANTKTDR